MVLLFVNLKPQAIIGVCYSFGMTQPEHLHHVDFVNRYSSGILTHTIHFHVRNTGGEMLFLIIPSVTAFLVNSLQFLECGKCIGILLYEFQIGLTIQFFGIHILSCEMPDGMKNLRLKTVESIFDRFGLSVIRHRGAMKYRKTLEETCCITFLMSALVISHNLIRTAAGDFNGHTVSPVLAVKILIRGYVIPKQSLTVSVHHFIYAGGTHLSLFIFVVEI